MSRLNYVDQCVIIVVNSDLGLVTSSEEGSSWLTKHKNYTVWTVFVKMGNAADSNQHNQHNQHNIINIIHRKVTCRYELLQLKAPSSLTQRWTGKS